MSKSKWFASKRKPLNAWQCTLVLLLSLCVSVSFTYALNGFETSNKQSEVTFAGEHAGMAFEGKFTKWQATLTLPPADSPRIEARFNMQSVDTGDSVYDSTLPEGDWFDVENHPQGLFVSDSVSIIDGGYKVKGNLTIKGITQAVEFDLLKDKRWLKAQFNIDRIAFNIGVESDPEAEWVSRNIAMSLKLES